MHKPQKLTSSRQGRGPGSPPPSAQSSKRAVDARGDKALRSGGVQEGDGDRAAIVKGCSILSVWPTLGAGGGTREHGCMGGIRHPSRDPTVLARGVRIAKSWGWGLDGARHMNPTGRKAYPLAVHRTPFCLGGGIRCVCHPTGGCAIHIPPGGWGHSYRQDGGVGLLRYPAHTSGLVACPVHHLSLSATHRSHPLGEG